MTAPDGRYPLRVVLAITAGVPGLAEASEMQVLLSHMTGTRIFLHQIPRAADICQKYLRDQYGWLGTMRPTQAQAENRNKLIAWIRACEKSRGTTLRIRALPGDAYTVMDPIRELIERHGSTNAVGSVGGNV